jgi:GNAT superfamily N-acetyltransferase
MQSVAVRTLDAVRVVRAQQADADRIEQFYLGLSGESRYQRFFSHHPRYTREELQHLAHPDLANEICLIAVIGKGEDAVVVGDLRCVRVPGDGREADKQGEIALVVADAWRRLGVGRLLLCHLVSYARGERYSSLFAYVASTNAGMLKLIREFQFWHEPLAGGANMRVLRRNVAAAWDDAAWQASAPCKNIQSDTVAQSAAVF